MATTKNLCAQISLDLHQKISEAREQSGLTTAQYITNLLIEYFEMKKNGGKVTMEANTRTMAFQNLQFYPGRRLGDGHISGSIQIQAPCKFLRRRLCLLRFCTLPLFSYLF